MLANQWHIWKLENPPLNPRKTSPLTSLAESSSEMQRAVAGRPSFSGQLVTGPPVATNAVSASFKPAWWRLWTGGRNFCCVRGVNSQWLSCQIRGVCCGVYRSTPVKWGKYFTLKQQNLTTTVTGRRFHLHWPTLLPATASDVPKLVSLLISTMWMQPV